MLEETITWLEMSALSQLVPGRPPPAPLQLKQVDATAATLLRMTYVRIGEPHACTGRTAWSDWEAELSRPGVRAWIARVDNQIAGMVELEAEPDGDTGIVVLGLVPAFVGKGFGGPLLTIATRFAWDEMSMAGGATRRVVVQTSSRDHPHAIPNYEARGYQAIRSARRSMDQS